MKKMFSLVFLLFLATSLSSYCQAAAYDVYVNRNSTSVTEDGSQENPYKTISAAVAAAESKPSDQRKIFIANGSYAENVAVNETMSLTGESALGTIIDGQGASQAVRINKTSSISNLTVLKGHTGIYVSPGAGATIRSAKILEAAKVGIEIEDSSAADSEKVTITNSDISKSTGKGFYIKKRRILIENNNIENNDEEGIDIRSGVKGSIKKNTISKNGESGIEVVVGSTGLKITSNKIKSNSASGISHQFYKDSKKTGSIKLKKNSIQKNDNYGLQCATPSGGDAPKNYWTKSIELVRNILSGNDKPFAKRCGFSTSKK